MNFETTSILLETLKPYIENSIIDISTDNKDWRNRDYKSDFVTLDAKNHVGFEVFDNEIIVYYFSDHYHFEDYTSELQDEEDNYIERAKVFLKELFEYKIKHIEYFKGNALYSEKYFIIYDDGREDECIGNTWFGLSKFINPFGKKSIKATTWQFDKSKGIFTTRQPKVIDQNAIEMIDINENCYIEIFKKDNTYTYKIMNMELDEYNGFYVWLPNTNISQSGFYDTKDNAINSAIEEIKNKGGAFNE